MTLEDVLDLATAEVVTALRSESTESSSRSIIRTSYWLLVHDDDGTVLSGFDATDRDAVDVLHKLIDSAGVEVALLVTRHSGSELVVTGYFRQQENRVVSCGPYRSHIRPGSDPPLIAEWQPLE